MFPIEAYFRVKIIILAMVTHKKWIEYVYDLLIYDQGLLGCLWVT